MFCRAKASSSRIRSREPIARQFVEERSQFPVAPPDQDALFEFGIDSCLLTRTRGHGDPNPVHLTWHAA